MRFSFESRCRIVQLVLAGQSPQAAAAACGASRATGYRLWAIVDLIAGQTLLGRAATLEDVGNAAVFAASDWARSTTAGVVNVSCGALVD